MNWENGYIEVIQRKVVQYDWEMRFYFQLVIHVCFYFWGRKTGGPPLATVLILMSAICSKKTKRLKIFMERKKSLNPLTPVAFCQKRHF